MTRRKPNNNQLRRERAAAATLRRYHTALVHIEPAQRQLVVSLKHLLRVNDENRIAHAMAEHPYQWTIFFAGFCTAPETGDYIKGGEIVLPGRYKLDNLFEGIEDEKAKILAGCNPRHVIGCGFIAVPYPAEISEGLAAELFSRAGAWQQAQRASA